MKYLTGFTYAPTQISHYDATTNISRAVNTFRMGAADSGVIDLICVGTYVSAFGPFGLHPDALPTQLSKY